MNRMDNRVDTFTDLLGGHYPIWPDVETAMSLLRSTYPDGQLGRGWVFRGQADARWGLTPSLYRSPLNETEVNRRCEYTKRFLCALSKQARIQISPSLEPHKRSDDEQIALAQHYGYPTHLLDFTYSAHVAAFFTTYGRPIESRIGVIYCLNQQEWSTFENPFACLGTTQPESEALLLEKGLHPAPPIRIIDPVYVPRIKLQKGLFVAVEKQGFNLLEVIIDRFYFVHSPGLVYQAPTFTEASLFPFDDPIADFAVGWRISNPQ